MADLRKEKRNPYKARVKNALKAQQKNENQNMANYFDNFYDQIISEQRHPSSKSQGLIDVGDYGFDKREANLPVLGDPALTNRGTAVNVINTIPINSRPHPSDFTDSGINDHKATSATQGWNRPSEWRRARQPDRCSSSSMAPGTSGTRWVLRR